MTGRSRIWLWLVIAFVLINVAGGIYAAVMREGPHAGLHALLAVLGAYLWSWLADAGGGATTGRRLPTEIAAASPELDDRLTNIERSVDAVAIEVERVGEGQRFMTKLFIDGESQVASGDADRVKVELERPT